MRYFIEELAQWVSRHENRPENKAKACYSLTLAILLDTLH